MSVFPKSVFTSGIVKSSVQKRLHVISTISPRGVEQVSLFSSSSSSSSSSTSSTSSSSTVQPTTTTSTTSTTIGYPYNSTTTRGMVHLGRMSSLIPSSSSLSTSSILLTTTTTTTTTSSTSRKSLARFHSTPASQSTILIAGLSVAGAALVARFAVQAFNGRSKVVEGDAETKGEGSGSSSSTTQETSEDETPNKTTKKAGAAAGAAAEAATHHSMGADYWAKRLYKGGFEDKMTRREAALILGVRESADPKRIQARHRQMLIANHPDVGGSTFLAGKINEAKDLLTKGTTSGKGGAN